MVRKFLFVAALALAALSASGRQASAQFIGGYGVNYGDVISPYLNLNLMSGQVGALGVPVYQNLVQPFVDGRENNIATANGINQLQGQINRGGGGGARGGGASSRYFMNYSHYYTGIRH